LSSDGSAMGFLRQIGSHFAWQSQSRKCCAEQTWVRVGMV
jgi:hypothetical protein